MFKIKNVSKGLCFEHLIFEFRYCLGFGASTLGFSSAMSYELSVIFGPPPFTVLTMTRPARNKMEIDMTAGL